MLIQAYSPARDIPSPGFNVEKNQSNVQPLVNPRKNDMDESYAILQLKMFRQPLTTDL